MFSEGFTSRQRQELLHRSSSLVRCPGWSTFAHRHSSCGHVVTANDVLPTHMFCYQVMGDAAHGSNLVERETMEAYFTTRLLSAPAGEALPQRQRELGEETSVRVRAQAVEHTNEGRKYGNEMPSANTAKHSGPRVRSQMVVQSSTMDQWMNAKGKKRENTDTA